MASFVFLGCTSLKVSQVQGLKGNEEICVVENANTRPAFRDAYLRRIRANGYRARAVKDRNDTGCELTSTYTATYGHHWGVYLKTSVLRIFRGDKVVGEANYRAPRASPEKHGRVEDKIGDMVNQLLPVI